MNVTAAYLNGAWVREADLVIPADDVGFMLGTTVSERLRTFGDQVFRASEHLARLCHSLQVIGLDASVICDQVQQAVTEAGVRGRSGLAAGDDLGITVLVTPPRPEAASSRRPYGTLAVYASPLPFAHWVDKYRTGERLILSQHRQVPASCWPSELKCRSRMHYYLADLQARRQDPAARALLLDKQGRVAEASTANFLLVKRDRIFSPLLDYVLPGVSLGFLQELAAEEQIPFEFDEIMPSDLAETDEMLLTSTSACLLPVCSYNGQAVGGRMPGPIFNRLLTAWGRHVGVDIVRQAEQFATRGG